MGARVPTSRAQAWRGIGGSPGNTAIFVPVVRLPLDKKRLCWQVLTGSLGHSSSARELAPWQFATGRSEPRRRARAPGRRGLREPGSSRARACNGTSRTGSDACLAWPGPVLDGGVVGRSANESTFGGSKASSSPTRSGSGIRPRRGHRGVTRSEGSATSATRIRESRPKFGRWTCSETSTTFPRSGG
jgi:hypothetical protein